LCCAICAALVGCVGSPTAAELSAPEFPSANQGFADYQAAVFDHIYPINLPSRTSRDIEFNLPFEIAADPQVPYRGQFLLLHGLNDSAGVWRDHAEALASLGFDTRALLFPGHGSTPKQMLEVRYEWWMSAARQQLVRYRKPDVPLYLGGFSMGAVVATRLALENPDIAGLFLVSPAFHSRLNHYLRFAGIYKQKKPWVFGGMILEDNPIKYNSITINSVWQFFRLTQSLKHRWDNQSLSIPTLIVASAEDSVIDTDYTQRLFKKRFPHPASRMILYQRDVTENSTTTATSNRIQRRASRFIEERILSQSHLGLMNAPSNAWFGKNGSVLVCNGNEPDIFFGCMRASGHWFGAQHEASPDGHAVARTTFNLEFDWVVENINEVFGG